MAGTLYADVPFGLRQLKLNPGFGAVTIPSLALASGKHFQLLDAIRLRGLSAKDPSQLATIQQAGDFFIVGSYNSREAAFTHADQRARSEATLAF